MMTPQVEEALGHLVCDLEAQLYRYLFDRPLTENVHGDELRTLLEAYTARRSHMIAVAVRSETPEAFRAALIADGTLPADYAWPWDTKRQGGQQA